MSDMLEYRKELEEELARLEKKQAENPSEYKERRIHILQDRLGVKL
jgi:hypothetical protein